jgi:hypothetical protein
MAYQIDRYNNTVLAIVEDGTIDQTTDLKLIGKNYAGYGEIQNENFLFLLENFSGANPPPRAISGQMWYDSGTSKLKFFDGTKWRTTGGSEIATAEPTGLSQGDFWWDTANNQLYTFSGTEMVLIGPQNAGEGVTAMVSESVQDISGNPHSIIKATLADEVIYVISPAEFTLNAITPITGFDRIKKGLTLVNTTLSTGGITSTEHRYWGTASNSDRLGGLVSSDFVQVAAPNFTSQTTFPDTGIIVGDGDLDLRIYIDSGDDNAVIENTNTGKTIKIKVNQSGAPVHTVSFDNEGIKPADDNVQMLGSGTKRFSNIYATNFTGTAQQASALIENGNPRTASQNTSNNTVVVRTASGDIAANLFQGTATKARYADLAEIYKTDQEYPVGTAIAVGGEEEARTASASDFAIGVISDKPAYLMNSEAEGQAVALKGRVPVRVQGRVSKGQAVYAWQNGISSTITTNALIGIALETNNDEGEKLVECVLKV